MRESLARGEPAVLILVRKAKISSLAENHQVVAIALEEDCAHTATLHLYDPNYPQQRRMIAICKKAPSSAEALRDMGGEPLRGFYVARYRPWRKALPMG